MARDEPKRRTKNNLMELDSSFLLLRVDANTQMGTGHLMRCLALAQAWHDYGGKPIFITSCDSNGLLQRLRDEDFRVIKLEATYPDPGERETTSQVLVEHPDAWVVLDGYHFDPSYQRWVNSTDHPLLVIDDMAHLNQYYAEVVLNQNIHAARLNYSGEHDTKYLLGTDYVLLRREFWSWCEWEREIPVVARKVLVTLGGSDPNNQTLKVIRALQEVNVCDIEVTIVVGASYPHYDKLNIVSSQLSFDIHIVQNVSNMPELMIWADVAVTAGGSTCWELAFLGLPSVLLVLADNQKEIAANLDKAGVVHSLGWYRNVTRNELADSLSHLLSDRKQRQKMSSAGQDLVDGKGAERVVSILNEVK